jgi:hypothetical protein|tara:strand:+ start:39 stop:245 length:207 start_codon:yes stop_codon:yes gene_type:complete
MVFYMGLYKDIIERAVWTAVQSFLAVFTVADLSTAKSASVAGMGALISAVKSIAATKVGDPNTAATIK